MESPPTSKVWQQEILGRPEPLREPLEERLLAFCDHLKNTMAYHEEDGYHFWPWAPEGLQYCGTCTNGAIAVVREFGGRVMGYPIKPGAPWLGEEAGGHDFAIVGPYLVDWWGCDYDTGIKVPVLHLVRDERIVRAKYKPISEWAEVNIPKV